MEAKAIPNKAKQAGASRVLAVSPCPVLTVRGK
jgi:hypothetical protein